MEPDQITLVVIAIISVVGTAGWVAILVKCFRRRKTKCKEDHLTHAHNLELGEVHCSKEALEIFLNVFEDWNLAFRNWFLDNKKDSTERQNHRAIQNYIRELIYYSEYVHKRMKTINVNWTLNNLLFLNRTKHNEPNKLQD